MARLRKYFADTRPLQSPDFRRLWIANIITVIGAQLTVVAVPAQIYDLTTSSAMVGLTGIFGLVPLIVFGLWGGTLADHMDRRKLLEFTTSGLILTSILFWLQAALAINNVWLLLSIFSLQQACFAVNQPARTAILPKIVPAEHIPAASALNMTVFAGGAIAGPLIAGALIPLLGYSYLYAIDALTLLATYYAVYRLPALPVDKPQGSPGLRSVIDGLQYLAGHPIVLGSFVIDLIAMIFGMPRALFPEIAHINFGGPTQGGYEFAFLYAAMPVGVLIGGLFSGWIGRVKKYGLAVIWSVLIWGLSIMALGIASSVAHGSSRTMLSIACMSLAIGGIADMASSAFRQGILLVAADDHVRGRLQGVFVVVVAGGPRLADVVHGLVAEPLGAATTVWVGGLAVVIASLIFTLVSRKFRTYSVNS
ncbi:MFS transporter [Arcanobacterium phocisimile]|uniref:MFS transporter n=1 Tax=Arcanobacterium phocisimile TaxID=1302235 RepID=A0ABX7IF27_9ACTO|nr:MFS transporter [Arcanobacterium phocisimile]QRV01743.1 MFS transporter [Arcanobacterium phocisimile]